jgi:hypothetical protein
MKIVMKMRRQLSDGANAIRAHFGGLVQSAVELQTIEHHRDKVGDVI